MWCFKFHGSANDRSHTLHWNDFSPLTVFLKNVNFPVALQDTLVGNKIRHILVLYTFKVSLMYGYTYDVVDQLTG